MGTPSTVRVDDDLTTSKTGVTLGATNNEAARGLDLQENEELLRGARKWTYVVGGSFVKEISWDNRLDDFLLDLPAEVLG